MLYSSLVIMFRVLKMVRLQDSIGDLPQQKYLFAIACILAANQSEFNIKGKPLYFKNISKAMFVSSNWVELIFAKNSPQVSMGLLTYEEW